MTDNNVAVKALSIKKRQKLTPIEIQQIKDFQHTYGTNNLISAIRFSRSANMQDVAKMLLQHCGVRTVLPPSIKGVIPDKETAEKTWSPEKFSVAIRLAGATISLEREVKDLAAPILSQLRSKAEPSKITTAFESAIVGAIRKYGVALVKCAVQFIPSRTDLSEEQMVELFQDWLNFASLRDWATVEKIQQVLGPSNTAAICGVPHPISLRVNKYFWAKANRAPTENERSTLWSILREHTVEDVIHAMSCIPSAEFSLRKIQKLLTPKDLWELYEYDIEERIATLFRQKIGRAPTKEEENLYVTLYEKADLNSYDFFNLAYQLSPADLSSANILDISIEDYKEDSSLAVDEDNSMLDDSDIEFAPPNAYYDYSTFDPDGEEDIE